MKCSWVSSYLCCRSEFTGPRPDDQQQPKSFFIYRTLRTEGYQQRQNKSCAIVGHVGIERALSNVVIIRNIESRGLAHNLSRLVGRLRTTFEKFLFFGTLRRTNRAAIFSSLVTVIVFVNYSSYYFILFLIN